MKKLKIILADDHTLVRAGLRELLQTFAEYQVVAEAGDGLEAIDLVTLLKPDIIIIDLAMPKMRGIEAIQEIKRRSPVTYVLVLSMHAREEYIRQSLENGADGFILKNSAAQELQIAINHISAGKMYFSPEISQTIVKDWLRETTPMRETSYTLSAREKAVLKLLAEGYTNKEVGKMLHISTKTVETHRARIKDKLNLSNITELVKYAIKEDIINL